MRRIIQNPLIGGSMVLFLGMTFTNFGNYLYHLLMGRMLGPKDYGILSSIISLSYIFSILTSALLITTVKFVTRYKAKRQFGKIYSLFIGLTKIFLIAGIIVFFIFLGGRKLIGNFLHLENSLPVLILAFGLGLNFPAFINNAFLQGFLNFGFLSFNNVFSTILKVALAILLVKFGFGVNGALGAIFLGSLLPYFLSFYPLRFLWQYKNGEEIEWKDFFGFSLPVVGAMLGLNSLYSTDVILVRHFFPAFEAGLYSALAVLGKIVFFASSVIPIVMFPLVSERFENGRKYLHLLYQSLLIVGGISLVITMIYFLFPSLMIEILYGKDYLGVAPYLGIFAVFISFYSLSSLLVNFFLSIRATRVAIFCLLAAVLQVILISLFHISLFQIIEISLGISILLFLSLVIFLRQNEKR